MISSRQGQTNNRVLQLIRHPYFLLFFLWFVLTAININKAFHIDDTFHLEAAEWIGEHPLHPMSGFINWDQVPEPIYQFNQPPLFFAVLAIVINVFGTSEIVLHLFLSIFTFLSLYLFYKLAQFFEAKNINRLLIFFAFCPALIVNQNLMTDVPILCLELGFVYFVLKANRNTPLKNYCIAALLLGLGLLIKYSLLPLLVVLPLIILIRKNNKNIVCFFIPILMLCVWSIWNYAEYGAVHLLNRERHKIELIHLRDFINCLGAISVLSIPFIDGLLSSKIVRGMVYSVCCLFLLSLLMMATGLVSESSYTNYLLSAFTINGIVIFIVLLIFYALTLQKNGSKVFINSDDFFIILVCLAMGAFLSLLAPFIATRHVLLVIPFILLLGRHLIDYASDWMNRLAMTITIVIGLLLAISDWQFADFYRTQAADLSLPKDKTVWFAGHWGWQWYAKKNGMREYDPGHKDIKDGDYLVYPEKISRQAVNHQLTLVSKKWEPANLGTFFSVSNAGLYSSGCKFPVWSLSRQPIDTVFIYRINIPGK